MGDVDDDPATWLEDTLQLPNESAVVLDALQGIDDYDLVERLVLEGRFPTVELVHIVAYQLPDRGNRARIQISAVPAPAELAQQVADDAVVRADVEADFLGGIFQVLE